MKLIVEYLAEAIKFEQMARQEEKPALKAALEQHAAAYRKLAAERAKKLGIPAPEFPKED